MLFNGNFSRQYHIDGSVIIYVFKSLGEMNYESQRCQHSYTNSFVRNVEFKSARKHFALLSNLNNILKELHQVLCELKISLAKKRTLLTKLV